MSLENKLNNRIRVSSNSKLFEYFLAGYMTLSSVIGYGCKHSNHPVPSPAPDNRPPVITSSLKTNADEGDNFFDKVVANDIDNDVLSYSLTQSPSGMTINSNDGSISWTDAKEGNHIISVEVNDGKGGKTSTSGNLNVRNKFDDLSGKVTNILNGNNTNNVSVVLGHNDSNGDFVPDFTTQTDVNGNYLFSRIQTGVSRKVRLGGSLNFKNHYAWS